MRRHPLHHTQSFGSYTHDPSFWNIWFAAYSVQSGLTYRQETGWRWSLQAGRLLPHLMRTYKWTWWLLLVHTESGTQRFEKFLPHTHPKNDDPLTLVPDGWALFSYKVYTTADGSHNVIRFSLSTFRSCSASNHYAPLHRRPVFSINPLWTTQHCPLQYCFLLRQYCHPNKTTPPIILVWLTKSYQAQQVDAEPTDWPAEAADTNSTEDTWRVVKNMMQETSAFLPLWALASHTR